MPKIYKVLVWPGGTEIGLEIQRALSSCKDIQLYSAGFEKATHAPFVFARHFPAPGIDDPAWLDAINGIAEKEKIDYIFPAHDDVLVALARNADKIAARIVASPVQTCLITRSKSQTYQCLQGVLPVPKLYPDIHSIDAYPVFVKPDKGQGSQGTVVVERREQLECMLGEGRDNIIMEYLPGDEFTIDCFSDRERGLLFCGGRQRIRTHGGISMNSRTVRDPAFEQYARLISGKLVFHGAWFFQLKKDRRGRYKLLEIGPRIAGTMAEHRVIGVNFPLLSLYEQERIPIEIMTNSVDVEIDRALTNRYRHGLQYSAVYVDLDDTLILNGRVNPHVIRFLYQCVNEGKRIILLTKHAGHVDETLKKHRLAGLFDKVILLNVNEAKSDHIRERDAILIDDSFRERKEVHERLGICTFDCSMIEMLLDERT